MTRRPLCMAAAAYVCGILAAFCLTGWWQLVIAILLTLLSIIFYKRRIPDNRWRTFYLFLPMIVCLGWNHMSQSQQIFLLKGVEEGRNLTASGTVYRCEYKNYKHLIYLNNLNFLKNQSNSNNSNFKNFTKDKRKYLPDASLGCIVYLKEQANLKIGSRVIVKGIVCLPMRASNQGQFNSLIYQRGQKIGLTIQGADVLDASPAYNVMKQTLQEYRKAIHKRIDLLADKEDASLLQAMLLGEGNVLDGEIKKLYQDNSISHILVISGLHFSMLGLFVYEMLRRIGASSKLGGGISIVLLFFYGVMTGFGTSSVRAFVMFGIAIVAKVLGKTYDMATALAVAIILILWDNPYALFQAGFLLSVGAILGLLLVFPILTEYFHLKGRALQAFGSCVSIQLFTLPLLLYFFYETGMYSVPVNMIIVPLSTITMLIAILALAGSVISLAIGRLLLLPVIGILHLNKKICLLAQALPFSKVIIGQPALVQIATYYGTLLFVLYLMKRDIEKKVLQDDTRKEKERKSDIKSALKRLAVITVLPLLFLLLIWKKRSNLQVTMLDVGQGESVYIRTRQGKVILYDGGSSDVSKVGTYRITPFIKAQGKGRIDYVIISHLDDDHISGIQEIISEEQLEIGSLLLPETSLQDEPYLALYNLAKEHGIAISTFGKGSILREESLSLTGLHPELNYQTDSRNDTSIVLHLEYQDFSMLLTGDIEEAAEEKLLREDGLEQVDVLVAAHHGSAHSGRIEFLEKTRPAITWISCGKDNSYGHPHKSLLERLKQYSQSTYITMNQGQLTIKTDGKRMVMEEYFK